MSLKKIIYWGATVIAALPAIICMPLPGYFSFHSFSTYAEQILIAYLVLGLLMLIFSKTHWMWVSFSCSAALCLYLRSSATEGIRFPSPLMGEPVYKVGQFEMSSINEHLDSALSNIKESKIDILCFQEVNPRADSILKKNLKLNYPYAFSLKRVDLYGMLIFSKYPFTNVDTFSVNNIPNIEGYIQFDEDKILRFVDSYIAPPFNEKGFAMLRKHLNDLSQRVLKEKNRTIVLGNYNCVPWSQEVCEYKTRCNILDSRLGLMLSYPSKINDFLNVPLEYIFYSKDIRCIGFDAMQSKLNQQYLGVIGKYQLSPLKK